MVSKVKASKKKNKGSKKVEEKKPQKVIVEPKSYKKRDELIDIEKKIRDNWEKQKIYESNNDEKKDKFYITFPFPYMNGKLHLGHAFSFSKCETMGRFQRLLGKNVLLPFSFHCTGMPIAACADKIKFEIENFGIPPKFDSSYPPEGQISQWDIMKKSGIPEEIISQFKDANHWLEYFPSHAKSDLEKFGVSVDFRRSFITTSKNPYYDSFVRWQFMKLKELGFISYGKKYSIFSPKIDQVCADHGRASGEGVKPKNYTVIKIKVEKPYLNVLKDFEKDERNIYLGAATLRPETMYGQTNCWLSPEDEYGAFEINDKEIMILTERAARNLSYQGFSKIPKKVCCLKKFKGKELFGSKLTSPNSPFKNIYCLPLMTIKNDKTTGVVTSVPSDSPDDYAAYNDLKNKKKLREKYGIKEEWISNEIVPIIDIPGYGDFAAKVVCERLKIVSQNDKNRLQTAKEEVYLAGFEKGVLKKNCGKWAGRKVKDVKDELTKELIKTGLAIPYSEPEEEVISRVGDVCVVALVSQWFLKYGEKEWKSKLDEHIKMNSKTFHTYHNDKIQKGIIATVDWLKEWGCSRTFGLGTQFPFDKQYVIESLSDSTIQMAYYTVAHFLQGDISGSKPGLLNIKPELMNEKAWDYVFLGKDYPKNENVPEEEKLQKMRKEFEYWYPMDLRCSGKDLIKNHLSMSLYNHVAIFPKKQWPRSYFANGFIAVDSVKMSKSKGNFLTLEQIGEEYSSDASRIALADAGDSLDDANFEKNIANKSILRLRTHIQWCEEMIQLIKAGKLRKGEKNQDDLMFETKINQAIIQAKQFYSDFIIREALRVCWYDFEKSRDEYRISCSSNENMHEDLIKKFIEIVTIIMSPITPHISEHVQLNILKKNKSVVHESWPIPGKVDTKLLLTAKYTKDSIHSFRQRYNTDVVFKKNKKFKKNVPNSAYIYLASDYSNDQKLALKTLKQVVIEKKGADIRISDVAVKIKSSIEDKKGMKKLMAFVNKKIQEFKKDGEEAFNTDLPLNEVQLMKDNLPIIKESLKIDNIFIYVVGDKDIKDPEKKAQMAIPLFPQICFDIVN